MDKISEFGFKESKKKPDLFYKNIDDKIILFFDFRCNKFFDLNSFYFQITEELTKEQKSYYNKIILNEFFNVVKKVKVPVDFNDLKECEICNKKYCFGYCEIDDDFSECCSKSCYKIAEKEYNKFRREEEERKVKRIFNTYEITRKALECPICKEKPKIKSDFSGITLEYKRHKHHIDYNTNKTVVVCPSCHTKITFHLDKYPELKKYKPIGDRKDMLKKLEEEEKKKREEKLKKRKQKEFQEMTSSRGMRGHRDGKWRYPPPYKSRSPMLGAWLK